INPETQIYSQSCLSILNFIDISNRFIYKNLVSCLIVVVDAAMVDVVVADVDTEVEDVRRRWLWMLWWWTWKRRWKT
ncbi:unnamed protein product, partial [Brassica napus]